MSTSAPLTINEVNNLSDDQFIKLFGNVVEHYPATALGILKNKPFANVNDICNAISVYIDDLTFTGKRTLIKRIQIKNDAAI